MSGNRLHPNGTGVLVVTPDGTLDLTDVSWQEIAPCGCVEGVHLAAAGDELLTTPEQAGRAFTQNETQYQRYVEQGFTWRAREHRAACEDMNTRCPHDPKWGVRKPPVPDGYVWAAVSALGSRPKYTHLVPTTAVAAAKARDYKASRSKPLCGAQAAFHWHDEWYATDGKVECKRCITAADRLLAGEVA